MIGDAKVYFPEAYSPKLRRSATPNSGFSKPVDFTGKLILFVGF